MYFLNSVIGWFFDLILLPFEKMNPWLGMTVVSLLTAFLMLFVFKLTSNQAAVRKAKDAIKAHLLEIRLFKDSPGIILAAERDVMKANFRYIAANTKPLLFMIIPLVLILAQLNIRFGSDALQPGEETLVKIKLKEGQDPVRLDPSLIPPTGFSLTAPPVRIPDEREAVWRIRATEKGVHVLRFKVGGLEIAKSAAVGTPPIAALPARAVSGKFLDLLLYPGEKPLPGASPVESIQVSYRPKRLGFFGLRMHWLIAYFVLSLAFGFAFKGVFKVEI